MSVAIWSHSIERSQLIGDRILKACLDNGCYTDVIAVRDEHHFARESEKRQFSTFICLARDPADLDKARRIKNEKSDIRIVVLTDCKETAVESYTLPADFCASPVLNKEDLTQIITLCFHS